VELTYVYATAAVMVLYFVAVLISGRFDPFAPIWLFFVGYVQVYVVQAISYHDWAIQVRGPDVVSNANIRSFWSLIWFIFVYHIGTGNLAARLLPRPPANWSTKLVTVMSPPLIIWGLVCSGMLLRSGPDDTDQLSPEAALLRSFPFIMLVAAIMLIVTGRSSTPQKPAYVYAGLATAGLYVLIWMFNGKRSHSLIGVLSSICAFYIARLKRPPWTVLIMTAVCGLIAVVIAISWRFDRSHERSLSGFVAFLGEFNPSWILVNMNIETEEDENQDPSKETTEYGGFLLMMDVVPHRAEYDYGMNYLRIFSTFIPRFIWTDKPLFGREQWVQAWIAGSEFKRDADFSGPAIGILGATQLNGGAEGTFIVFAGLATLLRMVYTYFLRNATNPWVQVFWAISYYNAWFMVVNDDPLVWFYYNYGFSTMPILVFLWLANRFMPSTPKPVDHVAENLSHPSHEDYSFSTT